MPVIVSSECHSWVEDNPAHRLVLKHATPLAQASINLRCARTSLEIAQRIFEEAADAYDSWPVRMLRLVGGGEEQHRGLERARKRLIKSQDAVLRAQNEVLFAYNLTGLSRSRSS